MVHGKSKWHEVRERVAAFIGEESIIVGHNVLFDIWMLSTHGIDLRNHHILDTFELSELFSTDAESLNLWYLAKKYGFDDGSEHRALDDTKLSIKLFQHYLTQVSLLSEPLLWFWQYARWKDTSGSIDILLRITGNRENKNYWHHSVLESTQELRKPPIKKSASTQYSLTSFGGDWNEEKSVIDRSLENGKLLILTTSKKQTQWLHSKLTPEYTVAIIRERASYISLSILKAWLEKDSWKRKEAILIIRLVHWILGTKTGILDEIKWYGEEIEYKYLFSLWEDEVTHFLLKDREVEQSSQILITESYNKDGKYSAYSEAIGTCILRDIGELESALRYRDTSVIDWWEMNQDIQKLTENTEAIEGGLFALSVLEEIVTTVIERPTWPNIIPPWEYGETYFFTQNDLWHRGNIWLIWAVEKLEQLTKHINQALESADPIASRSHKRLLCAIQQLIRLARVKNNNQSIILEIKNDRTRLSLFPREEKNQIQEFIKTHWGKTTIGSGYKITAPRVKKFLEDECWFDTTTLREIGTTQKIVQFSQEPVIVWNRCIILGTNLKQLRALSARLKAEKSEYEIFTQGISWWKSKMFQLFKKSKKAILIWLIDTWKDESFLWEITDTLSITKIPFDPPSDPSYLARTSGMSNNFELYSLPLWINKINTLIGRARSAQPSISIYISDEKLETMTWWRSIVDELL